MNIVVVGGGPAGLYFSYLVKRARRDWRVRVLERNPANATFGFGVVFSDRALEFLREDDPETYRYLTPHMESWPDLQIVHRDEAVPIDGNGFAAIGRLELLALLQARAAEAGVEIAFGRAVDSPGSVARDADLVVGADGVNSVVRRSLAAEFGAGEELLDNRFVWYGTPRRFETLTLTFRENADGVFCAHHYRYAPGMSTFIVECDAATWARAGFADMDEAATRAYCEAVFAADLDGRPLVSNRSIWRRFPLVRVERWSVGRTVLIGDALHTAHFSIGSGTRLAMEDAIALSRALSAHPADLPAAFARYEEARRRPVEALVAAATVSARWYEGMAERMALSPYAFAHSYMTRTGRVSDDRLREIAPRFMARYGEFAGAGGGASPGAQA